LKNSSFFGLDGQKASKICSEKIIIKENSKLKGAFDVLMLFLAVYSTFTSAF
jgi:hypothetical protein